MPNSAETSHTFWSAVTDGRVLLSHKVWVTYCWLAGVMKPAPGCWATWPLAVLRAPQRRRPKQSTTWVGEAFESIT